MIKSETKPFRTLYAPCFVDGGDSRRLRLYRHDANRLNFGDGNVLQLSLFTAFALAVLFYGVMLAGVAVRTRHLVDGAVFCLARPSLARCMVLLPAMSRRCFMVWWRFIPRYGYAFILALSRPYTGHLLYLSIPTSLLNINREEAISFSSSGRSLSACWSWRCYHWRLRDPRWGYGGYRLF